MPDRRRQATQDESRAGPSPAAGRRLHAELAEIDASAVQVLASELIAASSAAGFLAKSELSAREIEQILGRSS
jgi:hypothetical protein